VKFLGRISDAYKGGMSGTQTIGELMATMFQASSSTESLRESRAVAVSIRPGIDGQTQIDKYLDEQHSVQLARFRLLLGEP
jgi:hypothetical protein